MISFAYHSHHTCPECRTAIVRHAINANFEEERNQIQQAEGLTQDVARLREELEALQRRTRHQLRRYEIRRGHRSLGRLRGIRIIIEENGERTTLHPRFNRPYTFRRGRKKFLAFELT